MSACSVPVRSGPRWLAAVASVVAVATCVAQSGPAGAGEAPGGRRTRLFEVASSQVFHNVNRNDARAALKVMFDIAGRDKGFLLDSRLDIVDSVAEIRERLQSQSADLLLLAMNDYLELESSHLLVPVLTDSRSGQSGAGYSYVLVVNPASAVTSLAGLRGKRILAASRDGRSTAVMWLDVILGKEKLGRAATFFASVTTLEKPQTCILQLFFGTADACVVDEINLNLAKEMNPQVGQLKVLMRSRPMNGSVVALPSDTRPYQKELIEALLSLHEDPRGRQMLMVFRSDRLVRLQPGDLDAGRELWREYNRLPGAAAENHSPDRGKEQD